MNIQLPDTQLNVLISKDAVHEEEMMVSNFVKLTWNDATRYSLPVGSYIVYGGVKYRLFDEYQPDASGERTYKYAPQFEHPTMWLKHIPFLRIELDGTKRSEWSFSGYVRDLGAYLLNFLVTWGTDVDTEFGTDFNPSAFVSNHVQYSGGIGDMIINISFSAVDVWSALTQIAGQLDCEFHVDLASHKLYIGTIATGTSETLTVGENVGVPSISRNKEAYCNRYVVHGGTRNLTQQGADGTNYQSTNRLTLPDYFEDSVIDLREDWPTGDNVPQQPEGWANIKASPTEPAITGELVMDDVYPQVKFYLYDLKHRLRKRLLENGTESSETYATWYTKLAIRNGDNFTTYKMQDSVIATVVSNGTNSYGQQYIILNMAFGSGSQFTGGMLRPGFDEMEYGLYWVEISDGTNKELAQVSPHGGGTLTKCIFQVESLIYQNATTGTEITFIGGIDITKAPKNNIHSDRIAGVTLQCSFLPNYATGALDSPLTGRTFDIVTFNHSGTEHDNEDVDAQGQASQGMAFDDKTFRIEPVDENTLIIPQKSSQTLYPRANATANVVNNIVSLIGVKAPDTAIGVARTELLAAAIAAIKRKRLDNNTYTVKSYPQVFKSGNTSLSVGQAVTLINGTYTLATHVRKLVTRLDFPEIVEITVGNEKHKGPISTLKEQVSTVVYYGGGGVSAPAGGGSQSETPETTQMADRLAGNTPHRVWGQPYWQNGVPNDVSGSLSDVENILMDGFIEFGSNSRIYEDSYRKLKLRGYNGIETEHNLLIGTDLAIKTAAVGENGTDLLAYKSGDWGGVTGAHWFVGVAGVDGFIRSDGELKRWANDENQYTIWDSSNLTPSNYLQLTGGTLKGTLTFADSNGNAYGAIRAEKIGNDEYLYLWGNDGVLIDGLSVRKDSLIVPIEDVFLNLTGGMMEPGATITLQEIENNIPVQTLVASRRWVDAQGFLTSADMSGYATTSQLDTGLAAKQNKTHFLNTNDSDTEVAFSYLHLPLGSVNAGHASLDVLPSSGGDMTGDIDMQSNYLRFNFDSYIHDESGTLEIYGYDGITMNKRPTVHAGDKYVSVALETDVYEYLEGGTASISGTVVKKQDSGMTYSRDGNTYTLNGGNVDNGAIILRVNFAVTGSPVVKVTITPSSESNYDFGAVGLLNTDTLSSDGGVTSSIIKNGERTILAKASGTTAVTSFFKATEGSNYIEICYAKDSSASSGSDKVTISFDTLGFVPVNGGTMKGDLNLGAHQLKFQNGQIENTTLDGGYMHFASAGGQFHFHGDTNYGTCVAAAFNQQSDLTLKNVKRYLKPSVEDIAAAPIIEFSWKGDTYRRLHLGSAAQYWRDVFPQATLEDANGKLAMDYGAIALAGAIAAARKAVALEQRVSELERLLATK